MKKYLPHGLAIYIAFVFIQSLFFKFSGSEETVIIFASIGRWLAGLPVLHLLAEPFMLYGPWLIGSVELVASVLILWPRKRLSGALLGAAVMSGAIFFHLATPLGVNRVVDAAGNTDGGLLFIMACSVWLSCVVLIYLNRAGLGLHDSKRFPTL
ncbi:hypothetical protein [Reinekea sp.]|jgi:uncharacterized membrane protein YphA (DoxX/SURF4 family)|uniref:hypothetical protein n=1 Tax=Reinekea sp. TaxID=1970455 RepID=UPI002A80B8B5|nr:hypothetical protein [Reinekea sp.]